MKHLKTLLATVVLAALPLSAQQLIVYMADGREIPVEKILARPNGDLVATANGQQVPLKREQYVRALGARPGELAQATQLIAAGDVDKAKAMLNSAIRKSAFQTWDAVAAIQLADLYAKEGNGASANRTLNTIKERYGDNAESLFPGLQLVEWKTMVAQGKGAELEPELTKLVVEAPDRATQANAQMIRGDIKAARADFKGALLDYLRTVYFYEQQPAEHEQALFKTGETFQKLGETAHAKKYFDQLKAKYPQSEFIAKIPN